MSETGCQGLLVKSRKDITVCVYVCVFVTVFFLYLEASSEELIIKPPRSGTSPSLS